MPTPPPPLAGARLLFALDPAVAHLNHGSFGAVPIPVRHAQQRLRDQLDANPMRFFTQGLLDRLARTRRHVATFLGADPGGTALVTNVTAGVAVVLDSLRLDAGDEIVVTDHCYPAVALAVERERRRRKARVRTVALPLCPTEDEVVAAVSAAARPGRTRLAIVDHVTSATARLMPVARLAATLAELGVPLLVDAAHAPGMLPTRVDEIGATFWVGNLHKWAFAPVGSAALVVAPQWRARMEPTVVSHEYRAGFPSALEWLATWDYTGWLSAPTGLFVLRSLGLDEVRAHNAALAAYGQQTVGRALGIEPADLPGPCGACGEHGRADDQAQRPAPPVPAGGTGRGGHSPRGRPNEPDQRQTPAAPVPGARRCDAHVSMRIVPLPAGVAATAEAAAALRLRIASELRTEVAINPWAGRGLLRLSAQVYNRADEYDRLAERLPALLRAWA